MQNLFVEVDGSPVHPKKRAEVIEDYTAFLKKFEHKKTTDDCYTPPAVYNAVLDWVNEHYRGYCAPSIPVAITKAWSMRRTA